MTSTEEIFRDEWSRVLAILVRLLGDFHLAEEATQDAFTAAAEHWSHEGTPESPRAWLVTTARRKAVDRIRRSGRVLPMANPVPEDAPAVDISMQSGGILDERLALLFTCCHPALAREAQVALTLRALGGLTTREIAAGFLVPEQTMKKRLTRAKAKIRDSGIRFSVPPDHALVDRLREVLQVLYLIYNSAYRGEADLADEAIRLARMLRAMMPDEAEVTGLLALMLLQESRRSTREAGGVLVPLAMQDRSRWDKGLIVEALDILSTHRSATGFYLLQARIAAAYVFATVPWQHVLKLYDELLLIADTAVIRTNRAVVLAELEGPTAALDELDRVALPAYPWWHSTRAEMLHRLGRDDEALQAFRQARELVTSDPDRRFLTRRIEEVADR